MAKSSRIYLLLVAIGHIATVSTAWSQTVAISLNVYPTTNSNPLSGGVWVLAAKTASSNGISAIDAYISAINSSGIAYGGGINASLTSGNAFVYPGGVVNFVYFQDTSAPGVVVGVGLPAFSPGVDSLGDPAWANATAIANGTYNGVLPSFASAGGAVADANVLSSSVPPFLNALDAVTTSIVRVALTGDYDGNGVVDAADYIVWRHALGGAASLRNDGTSGVGLNDYTSWRVNFGAGSATSAALATTAASPVPEPHIAVTLAIAGLGFRSVANGVRSRRLRGAAEMASRAVDQGSHEPQSFS